MGYPAWVGNLGVIAVEGRNLFETLLLNLQRNGRSEYLFNGKWWIQATYDEWVAREFPWLSASSVKRFFRDLEEQGIVISRQEEKSMDRSKWYTIDFDALEELLK